LSADIIDFEIHKINSVLNHFKVTGEIKLAEYYKTDLDAAIGLLDKWDKKTDFKNHVIIDKMYTTVMDNLMKHETFKPMTKDSEHKKLYNLAVQEYNETLNELRINSFSFNSPLIFHKGNPEIISFMKYLERIKENHSDLDMAYIRLAKMHYEELISILKEAADKMGQFIVKWQHGEGNDFIIALSEAFKDRDVILSYIKLLNSFNKESSLTENITK
jgi:hypothetical protein